MGADDVADAKDALRTRLLAARRARGADDLAAARAAVLGQVVTLGRSQQWRRVAAYEPLRTEPGSIELLEALAAAGIAVIVPITLGDGQLDWEPWPERGALGADAVATVDAVLLPALAVALDGTRLGRGRGYYDRALLRCAPGVDRVAIVFDDELVDALPADAWDVPVGWALQPSGITRLGRNTAVAREI